MTVYGRTRLFYKQSKNLKTRFSMHGFILRTILFKAPIGLEIGYCHLESTRQDGWFPCLCATGRAQTKVITTNAWSTLKMWTGVIGNFGLILAAGDWRHLGQSGLSIKGQERLHVNHCRLSRQRFVLARIILCLEQRCIRRWPSIALTSATKNRHQICRSVSAK